MRDDPSMCMTLIHGCSEGELSAVSIMGDTLSYCIDKEG
jgi:hypothetical protein